MDKSISYKRYYNEKYLKSDDSNNYLDEITNDKKHFWSTTGRNGLAILFDLLEFEKGNNIMLPAFVAHGVALPIKRKGLIPMYYKSNEDLSPNIVDIEKKIKNKNVVAIFLIHYFGYPQEIESLIKIAKNNNVIIIEDCAQALYSTYSNGNLIGTKGDITLFSLTKFLPIPDGSLFVFNNAEIKFDLNKINYKHSAVSFFSVQFAKIQLQIATWQARSNYSIFNFGLNFFYKITTLIHYWLICLEKKHVNISKYSKDLLTKLDIKNIMNQRKINGSYVNKGLFVDKLNIYRKMNNNLCLTGIPILFSNRNYIKSYLKKKNIKTLVYNKFWWFVPNDEKCNFENEYEFHQNHLLLPISENLEKTQLDYIVKIVNELNL